MEAWEVVRGGLVADGTVNDVSTPIGFPRHCFPDTSIDSLWSSSGLEQAQRLIRAQ